MQYLHDEQEYIDRYDVGTIDECLYYYNNLKKDLIKNRSKFKNMTDDEFDKDVQKCISYTANIISGERFRRKSETIKTWMERDKKMQDLYDNTQAPSVSCKNCHFPMQVTSKDSMDSYEDTAYILFMYECAKCGKRNAYKDDGSEWVYTAPKCPKCGHELKTDIKYKGDITTYISSCSECKYFDKDIHDYGKFKKEQAEKEKREKMLLEHYRETFCWNEKDGFQYITTMNTIAELKREIEERKQKEANPKFQQAQKLNKLKVSELEELLSKTLIKEKYSNLLLGSPEMQKFVIIPFTAQDSDKERKERDSVHQLKKVIESALINTNWRLMSEGISYRMGYVYGRLKGYEQDEDLMEIV